MSSSSISSRYRLEDLLKETSPGSGSSPDSGSSLGSDKFPPLSSTYKPSSIPDMPNIIKGNTNTNIGLNKASDYVLSIYDKLTYMDMYGSSIFIVVLTTIMVLLAISFSLLIQNKQEIAADWENQRCKPKYMPFAGYIIEQEGKTPSQYTYENVQYCIQRNVTNMTSELTKPHVYLLNTVNAAFSATGDAINNLRGGLSTLRTNISTFVLNIMMRIANLLAPFLKIFLASKDILNKIQGALVAGMYTFLGTYYTIQSFIGAFFELMLTLLLIFVGILAVLWAIPLTWPTALSLSIPVATFASFFAIVVAVLSKMFHIPLIKTKVKVPTSCFDKNTLFSMYNDTVKKISDIEVGDILADGTKITAKMKLGLFDKRMFSLRGVIVSESHQVKHYGSWIFVKDHPDAIEIHGYKEPFIYCLNTSSKEIVLNGLEFLDWDELHDDCLFRALNLCASKMSDININKNLNTNSINIHRQLDNGFKSDFIIELRDTNKYIRDIKIGDILKNGGMVYGLVEIDGSDLYKHLGNNSDYKEKLYHLLSTNQQFSSNGQIINDYNHIIDSVI
jgi:hypothetical protein